MVQTCGAGSGNPYFSSIYITSRFAGSAQTTPNPLIGRGLTKLKGPQVVVSELFTHRSAVVVLLCQRSRQMRQLSLH